ncbi:LuxR family transcriptional regulator [Jiangella sp. DSM 45060]|uniref:helix-turn-helix transcriptional regulator n=1 Tax=Jiangella sp. DSM 45060 TaxID=1798224 RepID=UPI000879CB43|nr:regulatory protein, luxR family [Jiangella sp. DSM 45060]
MARRGPAFELRGRRDECDILARLLATARSGHSAVLVLRGEAGIGKSALLDHLVRQAAGCRGARAVGSESEQELAFAGLHQLCLPFLDRLDRLPAPQRDALVTAFGLRAGRPPERFLVGLAVLSLLADAAAERPLVCVVDDAQWLDQVSLQVLAFVARRLAAEAVAMVFATRDSHARQELAGLPELTVGGLSDIDARALLDSAVPGGLDERVRDQIVAESRGNPLALLELPRGSTAAELAGGFWRPDARPLAGRIEHSFLQRVRALPSTTQRLVLVAAAEPVGDVSLLLRAAALLDLGADAAGAAEDAGLIEIGARVRFRHPLVRTAAYRSADPGDRQEAHRALAEATDPDADPDRRAWHRAQAAAGPDETVAEELERSAGRAQSRGGVAAAAAFLERATELTPDPLRRGLRAIAAAEAKLRAGAPDRAHELLSTARWAPLDDLHRARLARLSAQVTSVRRPSSDAVPQLLDAARQLEPFDRAAARETYLEALGAAFFAGRLGPGLRAAAAAASAAPPGPRPPRPTDLLLDGVTLRLTEGYAAGVSPLTSALQAFRGDGGDVDDAVMSWLWLACPVAPEPIAPDLWDDDVWHDLAARAVQLARATGALNVLPVALSYRAAVHLHAGEFAAAATLIDESETIAAATGNAPLRYVPLMLAAWRGNEATARSSIDAAVREATARGEGRALGLAGYASAVLDNGLGHYAAALTAARTACEYEDLGFYGWTLVELVEAAVRSDRHDEARAALEQLDERAGSSGTNWALGVRARSKALLSDGKRAEDLYRAAIERLGGSHATVERARAHLLYGEWLRRENRRTNAREQLRTAHDAFARIGAGAFAERARRELHATGETVQRRSTGTHHSLTTQEAQIARLAGDGLTNPEIGAQLFISRHTVEWHLRKVFAKLDISSRRQLRTALTTTARAGVPG